MADYLIREIKRLAEQETRSGLTARAAYHLDFCRGASGRVIARLREQRLEAERVSANCRALVVVSDAALRKAVAGFYPSGLCKRRSSYRIRTNGYGDGQAAANSIGLASRGIGQRSAKQLTQ